jgi:hypothetical protein
MGDRLMDKDFHEHLNNSITELKEDGNYSNLLAELCNVRNNYFENHPNLAKSKVQSLSLNWSGTDEEKFRCLKLLRMKSYDTI